MKEVMKIEKVSFLYSGEEEEVLKEISFDIKKGEILGIIGENDSGKSTLCKILVGLIPHYITGELSGKITIEGKDLSNLSMGELSRKIGLVFQNPFNQLTYTTSTVRDELAFGLGNIGMPRDEMLERVNEMAKLMRISDILDRNPLYLSGGQVQRVALGSCLIMNPDIVVLDECCSQLDPLGSEEIFRIINDLKTRGMTLIIVDHDMERIARVSDRILVLNKGELVKLDQVKKIFGNQSLRRIIDVPDYTIMGEFLRQSGKGQEDVIVREEEIIQAINDR
ncbi:MAG: ABC transporter ATP-binding protein [Acetivibrio sp.]